MSLVIVVPLVILSAELNALTATLCLVQFYLAYIPWIPYVLNMFV